MLVSLVYDGALLNFSSTDFLFSSLINLISSLDFFQGIHERDTTVFRGCELIKGS